MITVTLTEEELELIVVALTWQSAVTIWSVAGTFLKDSEVSELKARMNLIDSLMGKLKASTEAGE